MRILIAHSRYLSGAASGENRVVDDEAKLLREAGHDVFVWEPSFEDMSGTLAAGANAVWSRKAIRRLNELSQQEEFDVLHYHNLFPALSPAVLRMTQGSARATVMTLHNYRLMCLPATLFRAGALCEDCVGKVPWRGVVHRCYRNSLGGSASLMSALTFHRSIKTFEHVDAYLAISEFVKQKHLVAGLSEDRLYVRPHFAWASERRQGAGDYFLYVGRLSPEKGAGILLDYWGDIDAPLRIVGDGPELQRLKGLAPPSVEFLGSVRPEQVRKLLSEARALLVPSVGFEGASKVVLEAYAAGVAVVASNIGALPEVVLDGESGFLADPADRMTWSESTLRLLDDSTCLRLGENAWNLWRERFGPTQGLRSLEHAYQTALNRRKHR